jgi:hypothetical protein
MDVIKLTGRISVFKDPEEKKKVDVLKYNELFFFYRSHSQYIATKHHRDL